MANTSRPEMVLGKESSKSSTSDSKRDKKQVPTSPLHNMALSSSSSLSSSLPYIKKPYSCALRPSILSSTTLAPLPPSMKRFNLSSSTPKTELQAPSTSSALSSSTKPILSIRTSPNSSSMAPSTAPASKETPIALPPSKETPSSHVTSPSSTPSPSTATSLAKAKSFSTLPPMKKTSMSTSPSTPLLQTLSSPSPTVSSPSSPSSLESLSSGEMSLLSSSSSSTVLPSSSSMDTSRPASTSSPSSSPSQATNSAALSYKAMPFTSSQSVPVNFSSSPPPASMNKTDSSTSLSSPVITLSSSTMVTATPPRASSSTALSSMVSMLKSSSKTCMSSPSKASSKFIVLPETAVESTFKHSSVPTALQADLTTTSRVSSSLPGVTLSLSEFMAKMHDLLNNLIAQRNTILGVMNTTLKSYLPDENTEFIQEQKMLSQMIELQAKIISTNEELQIARARNAQLEWELAHYQQSQLDSFENQDLQVLTCFDKHS